jgi:hypothetical protein
LPDLLALPEPLGGLLNWMVRQGSVSFADLAVFLGKDETSTGFLVDRLCDRGFVGEIELRGQAQYRVCLAPKRRRSLPSDLLQALDEKGERRDGGRY